MLLRPPVLVDEIYQKQSGQSIGSKQHSSKSGSKNKKKQTSLSIHKITDKKLINQHNDNTSIKSNNSGHSSSKGKRKETTLKINKDKYRNNNLKDNNQKYYHGEQPQPIIDYSQVNHFTQIKQQPSPIKTNIRSNNNQKVSNKNLSKCSPFSQLSDKDSEEDIPVYRIQEPERVKNKNNYIVSNSEDKTKQNIFIKNQRDLNIEPISIVYQEKQFDKNKKQVQKSQRFKIFQENSKIKQQSHFKVQNNNFQASQLRKASKGSKLGDLLRQSRQKKSVIPQGSKITDNSQKQVNFSSIDQSKFGSRKSSYAPNHAKVEFKQLQQIGYQDNSKFDIQSDLDLSQSHRGGSKQKQSLFFHLEPQKKKGISLASKNADNMIQISNDLVSKNIQKHHKIIKQNEQFLIQSGGLINLSNQIQSYKKTDENIKDLSRLGLKHESFPQRLPQNSVCRQKQTNKKSQKQKDQNRQKDLNKKQHVIKTKQIELKQKIDNSIIKQLQIMKKEPRNNNIIEKVNANMSKSISSIDSSKSKSRDKNKKQTTIKLKNKPFKIDNYNISPRQQPSFYQDDHGAIPQGNIQNFGQQQSKKNYQRQEKKQNKLKLISFSDNEQQSIQKQNFELKSQTDTNFYNNDLSEKSLKRAPSSKPPLSKKSNASSSHSKPKVKESSITKKEIIKKSQQQQKQYKKGSLMDLAMKKNHKQHSSSIESINSKQSSKKSTSSKKSKKKQGIIQLKQNGVKINKNIRPIQHEISQQKFTPIKVIEESRPIISKDCFFINQKGKLVKQDWVIKGNQIYSYSNSFNSQQQVYQRMKRSRQKKRERSRSRSHSKNKGSNSGSNSLTSFVSNQTSFSQTNYQKYDKNSKTLQQFIKPIQQIPYIKNQLREQFYEEKVEQPPTTLYELFGKPKRKVEKVEKMDNSKNKRTMRRTQNSNSKYR